MCSILNKDPVVIKLVLKKKKIKIDFNDLEIKTLDDLIELAKKYDSNNEFHFSRPTTALPTGGAVRGEQLQCTAADGARHRPSSIPPPETASVSGGVPLSAAARPRHLHLLAAA